MLGHKNSYKTRSKIYHIVYQIIKTTVTQPVE